MKYLLFFISLILAIIPVYLIGKYYYNKDTIKEPLKLLRKLFLAGILASFFVIYLSIILILFFPNYLDTDSITNKINLLAYCFIFVAFIEEITKYFMIYLIGYKNKEFDQAYDIILYSVIVGLGFACSENIIYIFSETDLVTTILRGITAVPAHACFQTIMGYFLYKYKISKQKKYLWLSIVIPTLIHGIYDYIVLSSSKATFIYFILLLAIIFPLSIIIIKKIVLIDKKNM